MNVSQLNLIGVMVYRLLGQFFVQYFLLMKGSYFCRKKPKSWQKRRNAACWRLSLRNRACLQKVQF